MKIWCQTTHEDLNNPTQLKIQTQPHKAFPFLKSRRLRTTNQQQQGERLPAKKIEIKTKTTWHTLSITGDLLFSIQTGRNQTTIAFSNKVKWKRGVRVFTSATKIGYLSWNVHNKLQRLSEKWGFPAPNIKLCWWNCDMWSKIMTFVYSSYRVVSFIKKG